MDGNSKLPTATSYTVPVLDTSLVTAALANPYAHTYSLYGMSPHYYHAYMQTLQTRSSVSTTSEGYTFSSTYAPRRDATQTRGNQPLPSASPDRPPAPPPEKKVISNPLTFGTWYQPGNARCQRQGCPFTGSRKSVEIHMMDRHFIFPPGWEHDKKSDWDADPSLKGKPILISGTSILLNTPEAVDGWIAERKKRFPTADRVQEKKRRLEEARARGQLLPEDMCLAGRKRRKHDHPVDRGVGFSRGRGRGVRGGRIGHRQGTFVARSESQVTAETIRSEVTPFAMPDKAIEGGTHMESEDDGPPEEASAKAPPASEPLIETHEQPSVPPRPYTRPARRPLPQSKKPPSNPFASRPALLKKLLLPEIRITISNLSQAIRFLVDNDFLQGVELRPGEAQEQLIEVIGSTETEVPTTSIHDSL